MALGSDYGFYGGGMGDMLWGGASGFSPFQSYAGYSAYTPTLGTGLPTTAAGFLGSYVPELMGLRNLGFQLGGDIQDVYSDWRAGGAGDPTAFAEELTQREDVQGLLQRQQMAEGTPFIRTEEGRGLADIVTELMEREGSLLSNVYGAAGVGADVAAEDIRRLLGGGASSIADLAAQEFYGGQGDLTQAGREAVAAQLLGGAGSLVGLGGGRAFNPLSGDLLTDEYALSTGAGGALVGDELMRMAGGLMSTQDLDLTGGLLGALGRAKETGSALTFGGSHGYRLPQSLLNYAQAGLLDTSDPTQSLISGANPEFQKYVDQWYSGNTWGGWGRGVGHDIGRWINSGTADQILSSAFG